MTTDALQLAKRFAALTREGKQEFVEKLAGAGISLSELPIVAAENERRRGAIPISSAQRSLWLTWQLNPEDSGYNMTGTLRFRGQLDTAAVRRTLAALIERHEPLRSRIHAEGDGTVCQEILPVAAVNLQVVDLSQCTREDRDNQLSHELQDFSLQAFRLEEGPPFRAKVWRVSEVEVVLAIALHHIAGDGWSLRLLIDEFLLLLQQDRNGSGPLLAPLPVQFADFAVWQNYVFEAGERQRQLAYWGTKIDPDHPPLQLPFDRPRGSGVSRREARRSFEIPRDVAIALKELARSNDASLFMVILALFKFMLHRFSGDSVVRVGVPVANRQRPESLKLVSYMTNVLVIETRIRRAATFRELLSEVRQTLLEAHGFPDLPFDALVEALQPKRQASVHPLFQVKCTQQDDGPSKWDLDGLSIELLPVQTGDSHFDLSLDFCDREQRVEGVFVYDTSLFDDATIRQFESTLLALARNLSEAPDCQLCEIANEEVPTLLHAALRTSEQRTVLDMWTDAVQRFPDRTAVHAEDGQYTYADLELHANRLAAQLLRHGVGTDARVGIYADRSCHFVLGVLSALKAGAAFVPLDPQLPVERLQYQIADSRTTVVLSAEPPAWELSVPLLHLSFKVQGRGDSHTRVEIHPEQAAYVIYTSGSTGQPKGVVIGHAALANYVQGLLATLDLPDNAVAIAMASTVAADLGHTSLFGALCSGRTLHLVSTAQAFDPDRFAAYMTQHLIDVLKIVPGHLQALMHAADASAALPRHSLILGGEPTPWPLVDRIGSLRPECRIVNHYGPTETTVGVLTHHPLADVRKAKTVPLGTPIAHVYASVLDAGLAPVPVGAVGELYVSGANVGRGYINRAGLTAERFVASTVMPGLRMYRTGDRVRTLIDGTLEFLGRADDQVKIRGYRIEPREVALAIGSSSPEVQQAEVIARTNNDGTHRLVAYLVSREGAALDPQLLLDRLKRVLPDYMLPAAFMQLDGIPMTANGKVDRAMLPDALPVGRQTYVAPIGAVEQTLAAIWRQVLRRERVGRNDNFFEIGGDSILALQIIARARREGLKLLPKQLLELQTIALISAVATTTEKNASPSLPVNEPEAFTLALTPIQHWFFEQSFEEAHHWNQSVMLTPIKQLDVGQLTTALNVVVGRHQVLRMRFERGEQGWGQHVAPLGKWSGIERMQVQSAAAISRIVDAFQQSLTLTSPFKAVWLDVSGGSSRLLLIAHHLIVDVVSWRILLGDLEDAYRQVVAGQSAHLPAVPTTFATWSSHLQDYAQTEGLKAELPYWIDVLSKEEPLLPGRTSADNLVRDQHTLGRSLDEILTERLLYDTSHAYRTQINDLLLTALTRTLCDWGKRDSVLVELEGHGRELPLKDVDLSRTAGWFTTLFPVRLKVDRSGVGGCIKAVKEALRRVPNKGIGFGLLRYMSPAGVVLADYPYPQVTFNYVGQLDQAMGVDTLWQIARESPGRLKAGSSRRRTWLEIVVGIHRGQVQFAWTYNALIHTAAEVEYLADKYMEELASVIDACQSGAGGVTPSDFPMANLTQDVLDRLPIAAALVQDIYPLSPLQSGLLFHAVLNPADTAYTNQIRIDLVGLDVPRFVRAWNLLVQRHDVLRTGFFDPDLGLQWVARSAEVPLRTFDFCGRANATFELDELAQAELLAGFDLITPPLMRLVLVKVAENLHQFIWTRHHLLLDGWSTARLFSELTKAYGGATDLGACGQYRNFIEWLQARDRGAAERYWRKVVGDLTEPTRLSPAPQNNKPRNRAEKFRLALTVDQCHMLRDFARTTHITMSTLVQAAWALVLRRFAGCSVVSFGVTSSGRPSDLDGAHETLGLFISTMPVVVEVTPGMVVGEWLGRLQAQNVASREHEHISLAEIQSWGHSGGQSQFDSIVIFENYPLVNQAEGDGESHTLNFTVQHVEDDTSYAMTLSVMEEATVAIEFAYDPGAFSAPYVERIAAHLQHSMIAISNPATVRICDLEYAAINETRELAKLGTNAKRYPAPALIHELIARQSAIHPDAVAVICDGHELSYQQLEAGANALAHRLLDRGIGTERRVGIAVERSVDMVIAILAVLKAGGTYVPLDPNYPGDRLLHIVNDSQIDLLLTHHRVVQRLPPLPSIEAIFIEPVSTSPKACVAPAIELHEEQLAYIIYTSGSTGQPKGVGITHASLVEHAQIAAGFFSLKAFDRSLQFSTLNFDGCVEQIFAPLLVGASVVMRGPDLWDARTFVDQLVKQRINVADLTTAYWTLLVQEFSRTGMPDVRDLRQVNVGGEALAPSAINAWRSSGLGHVKLLNTYGPTEATVTASVLDCSPYVAGDKKLPVHMGIGRPLPGRSLWVVDADMSLCPAGMTGDLLIGGDLLARGYVGRSGITSERFVADPFGHNGGRLYRTGDRVRWDADGDLEYLGRSDDQIKIRGFRVELGEISACLMQLAGVTDALAVMRSEGLTAQLVGYVCMATPASFNEDVALSTLRSKLPDYMLPAAIVAVDRFEFSSNGKINRTALPAPLLKVSGEGPHNEIEAELIRLWEQVLGVQGVGRDDNFFSLGGHSLTLLKLRARVQESLSHLLPLATYFDNPTPALLALQLTAVSMQERQGMADVEAMNMLLDGLEK